MRFDYGEILGTLGVDGDPVDVIVGPNLDAPLVYVVHQRRVNDWANYDEDKCCVGFDSQSDAEQAFLSNYDDPRFLGPITAMPVDEFVAKVRATRDAPAMIKAFEPVVLFFKAHVGAYLRGGKLVNVNGYQGRAARGVPAPGQLGLFSSNKPMGPSPFKGKDPVASTPDLFDEPAPESKRELIAEHERLVDVLNSPSHADDKVEAKRQEKELAEYKQESTEPDRVHVTETPKFKRWFGDSKVVDESGKPMVMYHGTTKDFKEFDVNAAQVSKGVGAKAVFLTAMPALASEYATGEGDGTGANVIAVYVRAENPFDFDNDDHMVALRKYEKENRYTDRSISYDIGAIRRGDWEAIESRRVQAAFRALGHDAFYVKEAGNKSLGVLDPTQIKSATGNNGEFDPASPEITKSLPVVFVKRR